MTIVGAGLAGLLAAHALPRARIVEMRARSGAEHKAVLRFRSPVVGEMTGIEFRPVTVRKGIWHEGQWREPNIQLANMYSQKVLWRIADRSLWSTESVTRWIAPEDFYGRLVDSLDNRIDWNTPATFDGPEAVVSTAPMHVALDAVGINTEGVEFAREPIHVRRFRVPACDVHQTVYFPTHRHGLYRASITGDLLTCEFMESMSQDTTLWWDELHQAFNLRDWPIVPLDDARQRYGKIAPIDDNTRRAFINRLTDEHNVFSLGRFATWRNILLDDVAHDISVVKRLINASNYERRLVAAGSGNNGS